jgi:hypothetical protein
MKFRPLIPKRYYTRAVKLGLMAKRNIAWGVFDRDTDNVNAMCVCADKAMATRIATLFNKEQSA